MTVSSALFPFEDAVVRFVPLVLASCGGDLPAFAFSGQEDGVSVHSDLCGASVGGDVVNAVGIRDLPVEDAVGACRVGGLFYLFGGGFGQ